MNKIDRGNTNNTTTTTMSPKRGNMKSKPILNRDELLQKIIRDRTLLNTYCQDLATRDSASLSPSPSPSPSTRNGVLKTAPIIQRDSYDLFFESACISIKSLPPKLAAEAKSRISQIITEFELRAISEEEAQQIAQNRRVKNEALVEPSSGIVYEFQPYV